MAGFQHMPSMMTLAGKYMEGVSLHTLIARFMGPTWGPSGADRTQVGPCWPHELCYLANDQSRWTAPVTGQISYEVNFLSNPYKIQPIARLWGWAMGCLLWVYPLIKFCLSHGSAVQNIIPDSKDHGANMGPTWVLPAPGRPHVGPMNLAIRDFILDLLIMASDCIW